MSADNFKVDPSQTADNSPLVDLKSLGPHELEDWVTSLNQPRWRADQIFRWLYAPDGVSTFDAMTNLPITLRQKLESAATITTFRVDHIQTAKDRTVKALLTLPSGRSFETVLIPDRDEHNQANRLTVCVSSQVGCAMGCSFCATGQMGFKENITCGLIADQVLFMNALAQEQYGRCITNVVYMGMGEPLLNFGHVTKSLQILTNPMGLGLSRRRITVSTVGISRRIRDLANVVPQVRLACSLHAPTDAKRAMIMPISRNEHAQLTPLMDALAYYREVTGERITFEYCMFDGFNDSIEDAQNLARLCHRVAGRVNLIMYNTVADLPFARTGRGQLNTFIKHLVEMNVTVTVRRSRGADIDAACGQLAVKTQSLQAT